MALVRLASLAGDSRLWIFNAPRQLSPNEVEQLGERLSGFLAQWTAHRKELEVAFEIVHDMFVVIAVDEEKMGASGCSLDALMAELIRIGGSLGIDLVDAPDVTYRDGNEIRAVTRSRFEELAEAGDVGQSTIVFDRTTPDLAAYRQGRFELPAGESWHARAFTLGERV